MFSFTIPFPSGQSKIDETLCCRDMPDIAPDCGKVALHFERCVCGGILLID